MPEVEIIEFYYEYRYCPICTTPLSRQEIDGRVREYCPNCGFIHFRNPVPTAGAVAIKDGKVVMIKRGREPAKGKWAFPSGFIELGETPEVAALRELEEESGVTGENLGLINVYYEDSDVYRDILVIMYLVKVTGGALRPGDDAADAKLFSVEEMPEFRFFSFRDTWVRAQEMAGELNINLE